jgi:hypothetical protein
MVSRGGRGWLRGACGRWWCRGGVARAAAGRVRDSRVSSVECVRRSVKSRELTVKVACVQSTVDRRIFSLGSQ